VAHLAPAGGRVWPAGLWHRAWLLFRAFLALFLP
jgi:hypothetical protein